jgi:hypothetical protein
MHHLVAQKITLSAEWNSQTELNGDASPSGHSPQSPAVGFKVGGDLCATPLGPAGQ